jgi:hypothetical protein
VKVFAFGRELIDELLKFGHSALRGADDGAVFARRIAAGLARVQPKLQRTGEQPIGHFPDIRFSVAFGNAITEVHSFTEGFFETRVLILHERCVRKNWAQL